ncbi:MAG: citrate (Si)-synthase [Marinilabiliales bacterium]|nr:MAG: citrate (Si)-synthase [Marinilabiliales bacterium]
MDPIKKKFVDKALPRVAEFRELLSEHSGKVIGEVTIGSVLTGMKGTVSLLCDTSKLDPEEGIRFRGYSIPELREKLPKKNPEGEPLPEGLFYLMLLDELPAMEDVDALSSDWASRAEVPEYVYRIIDSFPADTRPMVQFSAAILAMARDSKFMAAYLDGLGKKEHWDTTYEDVMDLIARLPRIAAYIYRRMYHDNKQIDPDPSLDWAANLAHMMGFDNYEVHRLLRLYMFLHADHEGGNVSAHATHLVGSALSNPYYAYAAGMTGLAGPLHGFANQEVIRWMFNMIEEIGPACDDKDKIRKYVLQQIEDGKVVPGYGHAVLRKTDPRFAAQLEFGQKYLPDDPWLITMTCLYELVPEVLGGISKIKNPWPNVDAGSGVLLMHYGIKQFDFYTVLFGVSRALGVLASLCWDRAYGLPIERPTSHPLDWFKKQAGI